MSRWKKVVASTPAKNHSADAPRLKRVANLRLLIATLAAAAVLGPAICFWHYRQVQRTAVAMLQRAAELAEKKDHLAAAQYYFQYLKLRPDDADAQTLLAETFDVAVGGDQRGASRAVEYYYQALGSAKPEKQRALHRRLAELLLQLRRFDSAAEEARELLKSDPNDPQGCRLLALALYGQVRGGAKPRGRDAAAVGEALVQAQRLRPADIEIAVILAAVYRDQPQLLNDEQQNLSDAERGQLADAVMDDMVAANLQSARAWLASYRYRSRYELPGAREALAAALQRGPQDCEVLLQAARQARRAAAALRKNGAPSDVESHCARAQKYYETAIAAAPAEELAYMALGDLFVEWGKPDRAADAWRLGLTRGNPASVDLNARLADLLIAGGKLDDAQAPLAMLTQAVEKLGPRLSRPARLTLQRTHDLLRGKWLTCKGRCIEAMRPLRRVAIGQPTTDVEVAQNVQAWQWLGVAYGAMGQWDLSATAYEQAAVLVTKVAGPRLQAAVAWMAAGRPDAAAACYEQALAIEPTPETWLALANVRLQQELRLPKDERQWEPFDRALAAAKRYDLQRATGIGWRLKLLEADYALTRADGPAQRKEAISDALALFHVLEKDHPREAELLATLATGYERLDKPAEADRLAGQIETLKGQAGAACLLKAKLCVGRRQYRQARDTLTAGLKTLPADTHRALRSELVRIAIGENRWDAAREQLLKLHKQEPDRIEWLVQLADVDFETAKFAEIEQWIKQIRQIEGAEGVTWRYHEARRLLAQTSDAQDEKLAQASELQARLQEQRPAWSKVHVLRGLLCEARGKFDAAIEAYQEAIRLGERQSPAYERLISLLTQADRLTEADRYLRLLRGQIAASETLSTLEIAVAARRGQIDRALEAARRGVERRPKDPLAHLWLGQILMAGGNNPEAQTELEKAVALAPGDIRALGGLFQFHVRTGQPARARDILAKVADNQKLNAAQRAGILALGSDLLGDRKQAEANYRQAAALAADEAAPQLQLVGYLLRTGGNEDRSEPERLLRDVLRRWPDSRPARRLLAALLLERGGEPEWQEALQLVETGDAEGSMYDVDRRTQALLLARRGGRENLDKACQILEDLVVDPKKAHAADCMRLAQLYESENKIELARQQYLKILTWQNSNAAYLAAYVELLLRHQRYDEAAEWIAKLETLRPQELVTVQLRARCLHGQGRDEQIEPLVEPLAERLLKKSAGDKQREVELALQVGNLYAAAGRSRAAERWYRRLLALSPQRYEPLAAALARADRTSEAIELCRAAAQTDKSARPSMTLAVVLMVGKPSADDFQLAEAMLTDAAANHENNADLLSLLAGVRVVQQRIEEAAQLYRRILKLKPTDVPTLNNLATLLGEQPGKRQEAIGYIDQAIRIVGPQPGLLDTKGMILVFEGKADEAVSLLQEAAATPQSDPRYHFHLAVACDRVGDAEKARAALKTAHQSQLTRQVLTPIDRQMLADLEKKYDKL